MQKVVLSGLLVSALCAPAFADGAPAGGATPSTTPSNVVEAQPIKEEPPLRFYGLGLDFSLYDSSGLNATYYTNTLDYWLLPSWQVGRLAFKGTRFETMMITGRFIFNTHLAGYDEASFDPSTNSAGRLQPCSNLTPSAQGGTIDPNAVMRCDYSPGARRTTYSDVTLGLSVPRIVTIPVLELTISPAISAVIPASREAQYFTLKTAIGGSIGFGRAFFDGKLKLTYTFGASKSFHESTTPQAQATSSSTTGGDTINGELLSSLVGANSSYFNNSGAFPAASWGMNNIFRLDVAATDKLSFGAVYWLRHGFKYGTPCDVTYGNISGHDTCAAGQQVASNSGSALTSDTVSVLQIFSVSAGYQVLDYLNLSVALFTQSPQRKPDGSLRQPFLYLDANGFSAVSLGATVSLEKAAAALF